MRDFVRPAVSHIHGFSGFAFATIYATNNTPETIKIIPKTRDGHSDSFFFFCCCMRLCHPRRPLLSRAAVLGRFSCRRIAKEGGQSRYALGLTQLLAKTVVA